MRAIQILVISLAGSDDRQTKVRAELAKTELSWRFLDAVRGSGLTEPPKEYSADKVKRLLGFELTPNELGCFLSHKKAWQECFFQNMPTVILEDDFYFLPHFEKTIDFLINRYSSWDAVRLQGLNPVLQELICNAGEISLVRNQGDAVGATAYIIKPNIAKKLVDASCAIYEPLDHFLEHRQKHQLAFLAINPYPVKNTGGKSTITDRPDRLPIKGYKKLMRSMARTLDRWFSRDPWFPK
jgi:glycosyl transferase family 25